MSLTMGSEGGDIDREGVDGSGGAVPMQELRAEQGVELPIDRLERAFGSELTSSMSLNVRGTAIAAGAPLGILLLAGFSATWLDDTHWELPSLSLMKVLLLGSIALLALAMVLAVVAVWPKRRWAEQQRQRLRSLAEGDVPLEAQLLLAMTERQRGTNERRAKLLRTAVWPLALAVTLTVAQGTIFALEADSLDPQRQGVAAPADALETRLPSSQDQLRLARTLAPRVLLHPEERFGPLDPDAFITASALMWHRRRDVEVVPRGQIDPRSLGRVCDDAPGGCYSWTGYLVREITRPFYDRGRVSGLSRHRGFALVPSVGVRRGTLGDHPNVPVFYEFRRSTSGQLLLTYWFFYGFSRPHVIPGSDESDGLLDKYSHEGDWENVEIVFAEDEQTPTKVLFYGHGKPKRIPWTKVCKVDVEDCDSSDLGHPIVYSAIDSHASYPQPGRHKAGKLLGSNVFDVTAGGGGRWDAWTAGGGVRPVTDAPWYGFGGSWGKAGGIAGVTGPLGPTRFKLPPDPDPGGA